MPSRKVSVPHRLQDFKKDPADDDDESPQKKCLSKEHRQVGKTQDLNHHHQGAPHPSAVDIPKAQKHASIASNTVEATIRNLRPGRLQRQSFSLQDITNRSNKITTKPAKMTVSEAQIPTVNAEHLSQAYPMPEANASTAERRSTRNSAPNARPPWADPQSENFDIIRWLKTVEYHPVDTLSQKPPPSYSYLDVQGRLKHPQKYATRASPKVEMISEHPRLAYHRKNGTDTPEIHAYYKNMPRDRVAPIAGIPPPNRRKSAVRGTQVEHKKSLPTSPLFPSLRKSQIAKLIVTDDEQEEGFYSRPSVKIVMPDHIKAILVDDWENVTKNQLLVPIPAEKPVETILNDYLEFETPRRVKGSAQMDILEEVIAGLKEYFERCLGRILLYR